MMNFYKNINFRTINKLFIVIFILLSSSAFAQFDMGDAPASYYKTASGVLLAPRNIASPNLMLGTIPTVELCPNWVPAGKNNNLPFGYSSSPSNYGYRESKANLGTKTNTPYMNGALVFIGEKNVSVEDQVQEVIGESNLYFDKSINRLHGVTNYLEVTFGGKSGALDDSIIIALSVSSNNDNSNQGTLATRIFALPGKSFETLKSVINTSSLQNIFSSALVVGRTKLISSTLIYTTFYSAQSILDFTSNTILNATLGYENDIYRLFGYKKPTIEAGTYTVNLIVRLLANYATGIRVVLDSFIDVFDISDTSVE